MKRTMLWSLAGLMLLAMGAFSAATAWDAILYPADVVNTNVTCSSTTGDVDSKMNCWVEIREPIPHVIWVTYLNVEYYRHEADLAYGERDEQTGNIQLQWAELHAHLNDAWGAPGYSEFAFAW